MKITARIRKPTVLAAKIKELKMPLSGGFEEGYKQGREDGYSEGKTAAQAAAEAHNAAILTDCNVVLPTKGVETAETLEQVPQRIGEIKVAEEILFSNYGVMYKRHMVIETNPAYGLGNNTYQQSTEMETLSVPYADMGSSISSSVFRDCAKLKTASLPKIRRIGNTFFGWCTALEEVTLGCSEVPIVQINNNSFLYCSALVRMNLIGAITTSFSLSSSPLLDDVSTQNIVDSLAEVATAQTLTLHAAVGAKLTEAQKATITAKNWTLVY